MRSFILEFSSITLLLLPGCGTRTDTSEAEIAPVAPTPIPASTPHAANIEAVEQVEPAVSESRSEPEFTLDPAPAPPTESLSDEPEASSAEDVFKSVARVLRGAVEGEANDVEEGSKGSVFGSIGRALRKGFQEAAAGENSNEQ